MTHDAADPQGYRVGVERSLETQVSQGLVAHHSEEHLTSTDKGIALLRRFLSEQLEVVAKGGNPAGTGFSEDTAYVRFEAGNFLL